jgi:iron complex outermembrane receptor protein
LPKRRLEITGGIVGISSTTASPLFNGSQKSENVAGYVQVQKGWGRLTVSSGARYEHFKLNDIQEGKPVLRAGVNYKLAKYTFLRSSYGQGYRFPSIAESFVSTTVGPISVFPNDELKSETGSNIEFGVKQGFSIKGLQMMLDASVFQMNFDNMMEFTFGQWGAALPPNYGAGFKTLNTAKARISGSEITLSFQKKKKHSSIQGFVGYTYTKSKSLDPTEVISTYNNGTRILTFLNTSSDTVGYNLKYRPQHLVKADVIYKYNKLVFGAGAGYSSVVKNIDKAFLDVVSGIQESIDKRLTARLLFNARAGYLISKTWKVNLIFSNITNVEYAIRPADLGAPRSGRLQISYTIDKSK